MMKPTMLLRALAVAGLVTGSLTIWAPAAVAVPPPVVTKVSPSGVTATTTPTYIWNAAGAGATLATAYRLHVRNVHGAAIDQVYSAAQVGCAGGGRCAVTPTTVLARNDTWVWNVVAYNSTGWGPWGSWLSFRVGGVPPRVILVSPSGTIDTSLPTYIWNAPGGATVYDLFVQFEPSTDRTRLILNQQFTAAQVGCVDDDRCSVVGPTGGPGNHAWWVRACNAAGCGPWSGAMVFSRR
jgi:hypothetical protein